MIYTRILFLFFLSLFNDIFHGIQAIDTSTRFNTLFFEAERGGYFFSHWKGGKNGRVEIKRKGWKSFSSHCAYTCDILLDILTQNNE